MKVLGIAAFTKQGWETADRLIDGFAGDYEISRYEENLGGWCGDLFASRAAAVIFVGACGIAVRTIAPYLKSKTTDPAVLVADEAGSYVISLLSGHQGGANRLAKQAAFLLGAQPVITTGTDVNGRFAVDVFAADNHLAIEDMGAAKEISAAVLRGEKIGLYVSHPVRGKIPPELTVLAGPEACAEEQISAMVCVSSAAPEKIFLPETLPPLTLHLRPQCCILGIGCKKGKTEEEIEASVDAALSAAGISIRQVAGAASAERKKEEEGLLSFCRKYHLPFAVYSAEQMENVRGSVSSSRFVKEVTGVDNVCERAALSMAGENARLLLKKQAGNGVTVAIAERDWSVSFEE